MKLKDLLGGARRARAAAAVFAALLAVATPAPGGALAQQTGAAGAPAPAAAGDQAARANHDRFRKLAEELRCLVCQNQTLADSNAGLAEDLRRQVEDLIAQGKSDEEIKDYLVQRYGDFVLYRPRVQGTTLLLWFGPFALLLAGAAIWLVVQRRSRQRRASESAAVDAAARERARELLQ